VRKGCFVKSSLLGIVREDMATCIFPDLVMKLVENNFIICNIVISEDIWARRVHLLRVSEARGKKGTSKGENRRENRIVAPELINKKR
jgi:hypothetical protein